MGQFQVRGNKNLPHQLKSFKKRIELLYGRVHFVELVNGIAVTQNSKHLFTYKNLYLKDGRFLLGDLYLKQFNSKQELINRLPQIVLVEQLKVGASTYLHHSFICNITASKVIEVLKNL